jgi:hypothetical protein
LAENEREEYFNTGEIEKSLILGWTWYSKKEIKRSMG